MALNVNSEMEEAIEKKVPELLAFFNSQESGHVKSQDRYLEALACHFSEDSTSIVRVFEVCV